MWGFFEIFTDNADKARLVTAILSVVAAVLVVFLTHALAQHRSRMDLRAKKMEEIYAAVSEFATMGWKYMHERAGEHDLETMSAYSEAHSKVEMLASIYANDLSKGLAEMNALVILTKDGGSEDLSRFPEKLDAYVKAQTAIQTKIASKARKLV
jgi:hypothetical protein